MINLLEKTRRAIERVGQLGSRADMIFVEFDAARILEAAVAIENRMAELDTPPPLYGTLISLKDLFDEAGQTTTAGSALLKGRPVAAADAEVVRRLKQAGALMFGRTTMSEFAYSGVGLNPHYGTPGSVFDESLIPGGSTSGGALSVALGIVDAALGTDTGGSARIPAAVNGLYGFKPTQARMPRDGVHPLSTTYDTVGPLAADLDTLVSLYRVSSNGAEVSGTEAGADAGIDRWMDARSSSDRADGRSSSDPLRLAVPVGAFTNGIDSITDDLFTSVCARVKSAGHELLTLDCSFLETASAANRIIVAVEAHAQFRDDLERLETCGDARVLKRIRFAETLSAEQIRQAYANRAQAVSKFAAALADVDALLAPTLCIAPPTISEAEADFDRVNAAMLRNCALINLADGCALSLPVSSDLACSAGGVSQHVPPGPGRAGRAVMVAASAGKDESVLAAGAVLDLLLNPVLQK